MRFQRIVLSFIVCAFLLFFADSLFQGGSYLYKQSVEIRSADFAEAADGLESALNQGYRMRYYFYEYAGLFNRLIGRRHVDNYYKLRNGHLVNVGGGLEVSDSVRATGELSRFCKEQGVRFLYVNVPKKYVSSEDLAPFGAEDFTEQKTDRFLSELQKAGVDMLDLREYIFNHYSDPYDAFFKTDHHWKISAGLCCAQVLSQHLHDHFGLELATEKIADNCFSLQYMPESWLGERGRKTGSMYSGLDDFELIKPIEETHFHLIIPNRKMDRSGDFSIMLDESRYKFRFGMRNYDTSFYYGYLFGNDPIQIIHNNDRDSGKILVIKDSFAQAVIPFLAMTADTVVAWDVRYNTDSLRDFIRQNDFDIVLVLYNESMINSYKQDRFMYDFS